MFYFSHLSIILFSALHLFLLFLQKGQIELDIAWANRTLGQKKFPCVMMWPVIQYEFGKQTDGLVLGESYHVIILMLFIS